MNKLTALILAVPFIITLQACEPHQLKFGGLSPSFTGGDVKGCRTAHDTLYISVSADSGDKEITVSPWADAGNLKERLKGSRLIARTSIDPTGPGRFLIFSRDEKPFLQITSRAKMNSLVLPGITIGPGGKIKPNKNTGRIWVKALLNTGESKIETEPGKQVEIISDGKKWHFVLVGASVPESSFKEKTDRGDGIVKEEAVFSADFVLYNDDQAQ